MRGKRSKQYRKLMQQYSLSFGFREPYQVLVDADMVRDADRFKMDLIAGLERTLHGKVKPMITQCSMRHLYANSKEPGVSFVIDKAKAYGRRRCDHLPEDYPEPLSTKECLASVVDPKGSGTNKHRYVVASQDLDVRKYMRSLKGVPLIYINRSVMIMEPMAEGSTGTREREERDKFRDGLRRTKGDLKRKRTEQEEGPAGQADDHEEVATKKKRRLGPKAPNPLSVKKSKKTPATAQNVAKSTTHGEAGQGLLPPVPGKKRRRGRKLHVEETSGGENRGAETVEEVSA